MPIRVTAPATTANLGPGFDCLGAALGVALEVTADPEGTAWEVLDESPVPSDPPPGPELVLRAIAAAGGEPSRGGGTIRTRIPLGAGLGSSAAAVAAGLLVGCALSGGDTDPARLLELGLPLEGHPDNLAACLYGGLTVVVPPGRPTDGSNRVVRFDPAASVRPFIVLPDERLSTAEARGALPETVPIGDAAANLAWTAGLVSMLTGALPPTRELLLTCTEDRLHQPYRAPLLRRTMGRVAELRERGYAATVSGAGPGIACFILEGERSEFLAAVSERAGWTVLETRWDPRGARILEPSGAHTGHAPGRN